MKDQWKIACVIAALGCVVLGLSIWFHKMDERATMPPGAVAYFDGGWLLLKSGEAVLGFGDAEWTKMVTNAPGRLKRVEIGDAGDTFWALNPPNSQILYTTWSEFERVKGAHGVKLQTNAIWLVETGEAAPKP